MSLIDEASMADWDRAAAKAQGVEVKPALERQEGGEHYKSMPIQPIEYIMANDPKGYYVRGAVTKYASRAGFKLYENMDATQSEITDWRKAMRYCEMRIRQLEGEAVV